MYINLSGQREMKYIVSAKRTEQFRLKTLSKRSQLSRRVDLMA